MNNEELKHFKSQDRVRATIECEHSQLMDCCTELLPRGAVVSIEKIRPVPPGNWEYDRQTGDLILRERPEKGMRRTLALVDKSRGLVINTAVALDMDEVMAVIGMVREHG